MTNPLFRQQVIDEQKNRIQGEVIISQPLSFNLITLGVLLVVICIILMLLYGTYERRETVLGYLVPDKGLVKIYASSQGVLTENHIQEGQYVEKGDVLLTVSTIQANESGGDPDALLLVELEHQKTDLHNKIQQEEALNLNRLNDLKQKISGVERELKQLLSSIILQKNQLKLENHFLLIQ